MSWFAALFLLAASFWETKPPKEWSEAELRPRLTDSPWAQLVTAPGKVSGPPVQIYIATATPIQQAESERDRRFRRKPAAAGDDLATEYRLWLEDNRTTQIILAIRMNNNGGFFDNKETQHMEDESVMRVGRKKIKMTGHFPPSASDPYLRLAFPRQVTPSDKSVSFELYLPGIDMPLREVEFRVKDMMVNGKLEM
jgi:hypothetical protein